MTADAHNVSLAGLGATGQQHFAAMVDGIYGTFATPAGKVFYLQTKAKIGGDGSKYSQLTKYLVPAREALNIKEMDFNQLLQRDLDDHRIATKLIPYILNPLQNSLPGFFPPIVAVLLPFNNKQQPVEYFSQPSFSIKEDPQYSSRFNMATHGRACRIQYLVDENNNPAGIPFAVIRWNPDEAKLVIMDGQHRAMSLLAIERTVTNSWHTASNGARYQPFYEEHIQKWLNAKSVDLSQLELPVTICWFPDEGGENRPRAHRAARKLFVDVNNSAKPPSEARLVLLSDTELENIFARELLNRLRRGDAGGTAEQWSKQFPLYGVEYDNPVKCLTTPRRWSVVTNLEILKDCVVRAVFGPPKLIKNAKSPLQGKPALKEMNRFMRDQLKVGDVFPKEFRDGPHSIIRENISNQIFPINDDSSHQKLLDAFYVGWGKGILHLLSQVEPYKAHLAALQARYQGWIAADNVQTLAKDALFEGVGMFWTILDGHQLWLENKKDADEKMLPTPSQPDVSRAWEILEKEERQRFQLLRTEYYLGKTDRSAEQVADSEKLYQGLITYAAQVGLVLAWVTIHHIAANGKDSFSVAEILAKAINKTLNSGPVQSRNRKKIFLKSSNDKGFRPLNALPKLEPAYAIYYRYFWLELILCDENRTELESQGIDFDAATKFLFQSRQVYLELLVGERRKAKLQDAAIKELPIEQQESKAKEMAVAEIIEDQAQARQYWFGGRIDDCRSLVKNAFLNESQSHDDDSDSDETGDDYPTI